MKRERERVNVRMGKDKANMWCDVKAIQPNGQKYQRLVIWKNRARVSNCLSIIICRMVFHLTDVQAFDVLSSTFVVRLLYFELYITGRCFRLQNVNCRKI